MINKKTIFSMICTIFTINAMEVEKEVKKICHLALLPADIKNEITSYLTFPNNESDKELIARTRACGTISKEHTSLVESLENNNEFPDMETDCSSRGTLRTYSSDCSKIISLELTKEAKVTIFDIHNKTTQESARLAELFKENINTIEFIAFSRTYSHSAQLRCEKRPQDDRAEVLSYEYYLYLKSILSNGEEQKFPIPGQYDDFISIGFNKQGTKIIVHAKDNGYWDDYIREDEKNESYYHIISLATPKEPKEKSEQTLEMYLKLIGCCKKFASKLPEQEKQ